MFRAQGLTYAYYFSRHSIGPTSCCINAERQAVATVKNVDQAESLHHHAQSYS